SSRCASRLRGIGEELKRRSNPFFSAGPMDCFAALAMTVEVSSLLQLAIAGIVSIARCLAAIEGRAVVGRQREAMLQTTRQVGIGDEDAAKRDGVGMTIGNRGLRAFP